MRSNNKAFSFIKIFMVILLISIGGLNAQTWGKISGFVRDAETGKPLPGANVIVDGTDLGAATDNEGRYIILRVPPGIYNVSVSFIGYKRAVMQNVRVYTDLTTEVNFNLEPGIVEGEKVYVVSTQPTVRKDLTSSEVRVQSDDISRIPANDIGRILDLQPGIVRDASGNIHIRGGRSSEIAYFVNGVNVTDDYNRGQTVVVENESVKELQVISGAFNAEYGNAMSGVVNIVTKGGSNEYEGKVEIYAGDYISSRDKIFYNIGKINPFSINNVQLSLSGPIIKNKMTFYFNLRNFHNEGWLYGVYAYLPQGRVVIDDSLGIHAKGDSSPVAMNPQDRISGHGAVEWKIGKSIVYKIDLIGNKYKSRWYNHQYRLNPKGLRGAKGFGFTTISKLTYLFSSKSFMDLIFSYKVDENKSMLYDDPYDSLYVHPDSLTAGAYEFFKAGTDLFRSTRKTESYIIKANITSQITTRHQLKFGFEFQKDFINLDEYTLIPATDENGVQIEPFIPQIPEKSNPNRIILDRSPDRIAAYIQDKMEYDFMVINFGLRYEYFNSNGRIPADPKDPNIYNPLRLEHIYKDLNSDGIIDLLEQVEDNKYTIEEREKFWYKKVRPKRLLSPRFGIAYPITDKGVIHFSYGIFEQIPDFFQLYYNDEMKLTEGQSIAGPFGNPDLKPQKTTMYEIGVRQEIYRNLVLDITGYYRDIRDWVSTSPPMPTYSAGVSYSKRINKDFAFVKGFSINLNHKVIDNFGFNINYTFQIAKGTNSSPEDEYLAITQGAEPRKQLAYLDWDQRHSLNWNIFYGARDYGISLSSNFFSGQPYTPEIVSGTLTGQNVIPGLSINIRRKPFRIIFDLYAYRMIDLEIFNIEVFLQVFNLFDAKNPLQVWADSGKPDYTVYQNQAIEADPTWFIRPDFYSEPRRVQFGVKFYY